MLFLLTSYFLESYLAAEMKVLKQGMNFIMKQVFFLIFFSKYLLPFREINHPARMLNCLFNFLMRKFGFGRLKCTARILLF